MKFKTIPAIILFSLFLGACSSPADTPADAQPVVPTIASTPSAATTPESPTAAPYAQLFKPEGLNEASPFCVPEGAESQFVVSCAENEITIEESDLRRGTDIILTREIPVDVFGFSLETEVTSLPSVPARLDQNQAGFYFQTVDERQFALRLQGQYFNFEEWTVENGKEKTITLNQSYAPAMLSAGRPNNMRLVCVPDNCDLFANETLAGRFPLTDTTGFTAIGYFAASPWYERFGTVTISKLTIEELSATRPETQPYILVDDLTADYGSFAQMGLSGAFSDFEADGFHFSPVIPYGYYSAKAGPALHDVSVSATVEMDFTPGVPATQYGGVMCRASNEGMVTAVLRANATYTIYRDSVRRAFAMLATEPVESIQEGRSAHRMQLDCIGDLISLYIDGEQVESLTDTRYGIQYGRSGLYTKAGGAAYSDAIVFSDFEISEIR